MSHFDQYGPDDLMQFEVNLDIPAFVRDAVRSKMKRDTILVYLHMVSQTYQATDKMRRFATVAQEEDLTRNEILIWLHLSYGGSMEPRHISRKHGTRIGDLGIRPAGAMAIRLQQDVGTHEFQRTVLSFAN